MIDIEWKDFWWNNITGANMIVLKVANALVLPPFFVPGAMLVLIQNGKRRNRETDAVALHKMIHFRLSASYHIVDVYDNIKLTPCNN